MEPTEFFQTLRSLWVLWLILAFGIVLWWAYRPKNKKRFEEDARIPFKDGDGD
ncbi:MAG: cbb3-type cytochrome c oxidase subunit 3 [Defluviicoccus sp.]|nr:MAG: cbb3-type cytochrome c oxidase subunit 3 [Defluviicoccus sp.]